MIVLQEGAGIKKGDVICLYWWRAAVSADAAIIAVCSQRLETVPVEIMCVRRPPYYINVTLGSDETLSLRKRKKEQQERKTKQRYYDKQDRTEDDGLIGYRQQNYWEEF